MSREKRRGRRSKRVALRPHLAAFGHGLGRRLALAVLLALAVPAAAVSLFVFGCQSSGPASPPRAAIVDQLSLTFPNPDFRQEATALLEQVGYEVDYFPGEEVTLDLFRDLPTHGYGHLILRVHSTAVLREASGATSTDEIFLFTGQPYSRTAYADERIAGHLVRTHYSEDDPRYYFGIAPSFIRSKMNGDLDGATVIAMGCDSLDSDAIASAFVDKGAETVIGWDGGVSATHTDAATEHLLRYLLVDNMEPGEAVAQTMADVGPDPSHGSKLVLYPPEASASAAQ